MVHACLSYVVDHPPIANLFQCGFSYAYSCACAAVDKFIVHSRSPCVLSVLLVYITVNPRYIELS